jgi:SET domain-containing protein
MPPKEDYINPKIEIKETLDRGKGMFATEQIPKGETVIIWGGNYFGKEEADKAKSEGKLVMQFDENLFSIEDRGESNTYFINHSCEPNVWMRNAFTLEAMINIEKGEELTTDYAMWENDENKISKWECKCGSPNCRHIVTGKDWKLKELQEKYKDHFLPLINKKILKMI